MTTILALVIHEHRQQRGWSVGQLAEALRCTERYVVELEMGKVRRPRLPVLEGLVALGVHAGELMFAVGAISDEQRSRLGERIRQLPRPTLYEYGPVSDATIAYWRQVVSVVLEWHARPTAGPNRADADGDEIGCEP